MHQAACLNLLTNAVIAWNTVYMAAAIDRLRIDGHPVQEADLAHAVAVPLRAHQPVRQVHLRCRARTSARPASPAPSGAATGLATFFAFSAYR